VPMRRASFSDDISRYDDMTRPPDERFYGRDASAGASWGVAFIFKKKEDPVGIKGIGPSRNSFCAT
jgi:hypothetical protein